MAPFFMLGVSRFLILQKALALVFPFAGAKHDAYATKQTTTASHY